MTDERASSPVLGNVAEHSMFNLVPYTGARWKMTNMTSSAIGWPIPVMQLSTGESGCRCSQTAHGSWTNRVSLPSEFVRQLRGTLASPSQRGLRIPPRGWIDQSLRRRGQSRICSGRSFAASPRLTQPRIGNHFRDTLSLSSSSANPFLMVFKEMPVARLAARRPPRPYARASTAAH
jgi:hypothetical protein